MKKIICALLIAVLCLSLCACNKAQRVEGTCTVYVYTSEHDYKTYTVDLSDVEVTDNAYSVIEYIHNKKGVLLSASDSAYGKFLTGFDTLVAGESSFIALYTTYEADWATPGEYTKALFIGETRFVTAGVGISSLTVADGVSILLTVESYA